MATEGPMMESTRPDSWSDALFLCATLMLVLFFVFWICAKISVQRDRVYAREYWHNRHEVWRDKTCAEWREKFTPETLADNEYYQRLCIRKDI